MRRSKVFSTTSLAEPSDICLAIQEDGLIKIVPNPVSGLKEQTLYSDGQKSTLDLISLIAVMHAIPEIALVLNRIAEDPNVVKILNDKLHLQ